MSKKVNLINLNSRLHIKITHLHFATTLPTQDLKYNKYILNYSHRLIV